MEENLLLTVKEVGEWIRLKPRTIYHWVKQGRLKVYFEGLKVRSSLDLDQGKIGLGISPDDLGIVLFAIGQLDQLIYNRGILKNLRLPVEICEVLGDKPWILYHLNINGVFCTMEFSDEFLPSCFMFL